MDIFINIYNIRQKVESNTKGLQMKRSAGSGNRKVISS